MTKTLNDFIRTYHQQIKIGDIQKAYRGLIDYLMNLRTHFSKEYPVDYITGKVSPGYMDISYFPFTPLSLKAHKLKIAIVYHHAANRFEIWLTGHNRQIQKQYWDIFKNSDWNKYHIPSNTKDGFSIIDHVLVEEPDFNNLTALTQQIETKTMEFIEDMVEVLVE